MRDVQGEGSRRMRDPCDEGSVGGFRRIRACASEMMPRRSKTVVAPSSVRSGGKELHIRTRVAHVNHITKYDWPLRHRSEGSTSMPW